MEEQNNLNTGGIGAQTTVFISGEISWTMVSPEEMIAEQRKIRKFIGALVWAAWLMSIHMVIMLIEMLRYVISSGGPEGNSKIPEISTLIILSPLVVIGLLLVILKPDQSQYEMLDAPSSASDCVGKVMTVYFSVTFMLVMWISICFVEPAGRTTGLFIILVDMITGFYFLCSSWAAGNVLMLREKKLSESIELGVEMRNIF